MLFRSKGDVATLHKLTLPMKFKDKNGDEVQRPPICVFIWGDFQFQGVVEKLKVDFKLFDANGVPRRAECKVTMKGRALSQASSAEDFLSGSDFKGKIKEGKFKGRDKVKDTKVGGLIDALSS